MNTAEQDTKQFTEENDVLKQFMELLNQQNMGEQSQENQPKSVKENLMDKLTHLQEKITNLSERLSAVKDHLLETAVFEDIYRIYTGEILRTEN